MSVSVELFDQGYVCDKSTGVWVRETFSGIAYSDGDEIETRVARIIAGAADLSVLSPELRQHCTDWPSLYHLSGTRANIIRPLAAELQGVRVLEIGAGCGAITRYLGEAGAQVLALEGSVRRASIARSRTRDLDNVTVVADRFADFATSETFDLITLIGVFEYANLFSPGEDPAGAMLRRIRQLLKPGGKLVIAIENQLGLKYFMGAPEDHLGEAMYGLENRYQKNQPQTFGRLQLERIVRENGFVDTHFFLPFPDYKLPESIVSETALAAADFDASAFAWQSVRHDHQLPTYLNFSPELVWPVLFNNGIALDLANSFLLVAETVAVDNAYPVLAYHFSTGRKPAYCKETLFKRRGDGSIGVFCQQLSGVKSDESNAIIRYLPLPESDYVYGTPMSQELVKIVSKHGWQIDELVGFFIRYRAVLVELMKEQGLQTTSIPSTGDFTLPGNFFDIVPQNLIWKKTGGWVVIDREWHLQADIRFCQLVYRSLLILSDVITHVGKGANIYPFEWGEVIRRVFSELHLDISVENISALLEFEGKVQASITGRSVNAALQQWMGRPLPTQVTLVERDQQLAKRLQEIAIRDQHLSIEVQRVEQLQSSLSRLNSGRFLLKSLLKLIAQRTGLLALSSQYRLRQQLLKSGLFDPDYYLRTYPDIAAAGVDPLEHYLTQGWQERRNPSANFSNSGYLALYDDVRIKAVDPLTDYWLRGRQEGRAIQTLSGEFVVLPHQKSHIASLINVMNIVVKRPQLILKFAQEVRRHGLSHTLELLALKLKRHSKQRPITVSMPVAIPQRSMWLYEKLQIVPYYLNPYLQTPPTLAAKKVAIHLHLQYDDLLESCIRYLQNIPVSFDLYVSIPDGNSMDTTEQRLHDELVHLQQLIIESVPSRGQHIASFILQFGSRLVEYDYIAHFHTIKHEHNSHVKNGFDTVMSSLCGSSSGVMQIFALLDNDANVVFTSNYSVTESDNSGWRSNRVAASAFLAKYSTVDSNDFPYVEFPEHAMLWAKSACLKDFLSLPLSYQDFPEELAVSDTSLNQVLEQLILVYASCHKGRNYRLESPELPQELGAYYEEQYDYSPEITHPNIKVLAYYLPQFHPTPENDEWHGEGFTEWYKVGAANPLFLNHYQQHIPHPDMGYYHLDSPERLEQQAQMMHKSGVQGMVFYHYWFSGKLILEKPAQMLLANPQINMPFSFCWANENWTRRWDGNEREILLGQVYSKDDARDFIRYLIPFFKDPRHITIDQRPLLFVYRPSSMEHCDDYLRIWREECEQAGIPAPYVVATLTRGATSPHDFGMDAAVERVLHDWTGNAVPELKQELHPYWPINGSVLAYEGVANHYMRKKMDSDYVLFRSLVPVWDNTARYGSEAYVLHDFSPKKMQEWMEHLIRYSEQHLQSDKQFVIVNAWNEWAEGAHLEPDTRFGYGYLNSIGRALCDYAFDAYNYLKFPEGLCLNIVVEPELLATFQGDIRARHAFLYCLTQAASCNHFTLCTDSPELAAALKAIDVDCYEPAVDNASASLVFNKLLVFPAQTLVELVQMSQRHQGFCINASLLNAPEFLHNETAVNFEIGYAQRSGMELRPLGDFRGYKVCCTAPCFQMSANQSTVDSSALPKVATIIRFHHAGNKRWLINALYSLLAQVGCKVQPWLALQDMTDIQVDELQAELRQLPWHEGCQPIIRRYSSGKENSDLRSLMLNDSLKAIGSGYAAFLDYDDLLFPWAYKTLFNRLESNGKNAGFGRVYSTTVDADSGMILKRERVYEHGNTYAEFLEDNHAPLHSFMLNLDHINLDQIRYFDDMKYMEDYYLTLQIFSERDTDWESLNNSVFIGDYIHRRGGDAHTLALTSAEERSRVLVDQHYQLCEQRINELRRVLVAKSSRVSRES